MQFIICTSLYTFHYAFHACNSMHSVSHSILYSLHSILLLLYRTLNIQRNSKSTISPDGLNTEGIHPQWRDTGAACLVASKITPIFFMHPSLVSLLLYVMDHKTFCTMCVKCVMAIFTLHDVWLLGGSCIEGVYCFTARFVQFVRVIFWL